ncbi:MAG: hypothetical protein MUP55_03910 [Candidatus Aenigmarchaeota archaeon]|nr:hypothetical protein [Candidatus Aenigmarchaeota archaeon]
MVYDYQPKQKAYSYRIIDPDNKLLNQRTDIILASKAITAELRALLDATEWLLFSDPYIQDLTLYAHSECVDKQFCLFDKGNGDMRKKLLERLESIKYDIVPPNRMILPVLLKDIKEFIEQHEDMVSHEDWSGLRLQRGQDGLDMYWKGRLCGTIKDEKYVSVRYPGHFCRVASGWGVQVSIVKFLQLKGIRSIEIVYHGKTGLRYFRLSTEEFVENSRTLCLNADDGEQMFVRHDYWRQDPPSAQPGWQF